jgi:hypothetical protein
MIKSLFSALLATMPAGAQADAQPPVAAPPAPPAPPMPMVTRPPMIVVPDRPSAQPASTFEVEVSAGTSRLWSATVRTAYGRPAAFRQSLDQAAPDGCNQEVGERQVGQRLEVTIIPTGYGPSAGQADRFMIQATWTRPASPGSCPDLGSRTVQVQRYLALRAGQAIEVEGDAGLRIRLRRID